MATKGRKRQEFDPDENYGLTQEQIQELIEILGSTESRHIASEENDDPVEEIDQYDPRSPFYATFHDPIHEEQKKRLAIFLKWQIRENYCTKAGFARKIRINPKTFENWIQGTTILNMSRMVILCDILKIDPVYLAAYIMDRPIGGVPISKRPRSLSIYNALENLSIDEQISFYLHLQQLIFSPKNIHVLKRLDAIKEVFARNVLEE